MNKLGFNIIVLIVSLLYIDLLYIDLWAIDQNGCAQNLYYRDEIIQALHNKPLKSFNKKEVHELAIGLLKANSFLGHSNHDVKIKSIKIIEPHPFYPTVKVEY